MPTKPDDSASQPSNSPDEKREAGGKKRSTEKPEGVASTTTEGGGEPFTHASQPVVRPPGLIFMTPFEAEQALKEGEKE